MSGTKQKRQTEVQGTAWIQAMLDLLKGGVLGCVIAMVMLLAAAALISAGMLGEELADSVVIAACLLSALAGGVYTVRRRKWGALPTGLGTGVVQFLVLLTAGMLLYNAIPTIGSGGVIFGACLCGGGLAGILGGKTKKKRRK